MPRVTFTPKDQAFSTFSPAPAPSIKFIAEWYRSLSPDLTYDTPKGKCPVIKEDGSYGRTIKACKPVLDAFGMGYIIPLPVDVGVRPDPDRPAEGPGSKNMLFNWGAGDIYSSHGSAQVEGMSRCLVNPGKWVNPWSVRTPRGYSCIITHPFNHSELPFRAMTGIVDTDNYCNEVNFPFDWVEPDFNGILPAGTPMVQVIPFKREAWAHKVAKWTVAHGKKLSATKFALTAKLLDGYASLFWVKKSFR